MSLLKAYLIFVTDGVRKFVDRIFRIKDDSSNDLINTTVSIKQSSLQTPPAPAGTVSAVVVDEHIGTTSVQPNRLDLGEARRVVAKKLQEIKGLRSEKKAVVSSTAVPTASVAVVTTAPTPPIAIVATATTGAAVSIETPALVSSATAVIVADDSLPIFEEISSKLSESVSSQYLQFSSDVSSALSGFQTTLEKFVTSANEFAESLNAKASPTATLFAVPDYMKVQTGPVVTSTQQQ
jgi:hypothetical protein